MNVFEAVKPAVTARQAAEQYGIRVNEHGMAVCPFHHDKNPSIKLDNRFQCFACQADGDAIDFVSRLFGIPSKAAAMKLADDLGIVYDIRQGPTVRPHIREPTLEQDCRDEEYCCKVLSKYFRLLRMWEEQYAPRTPEDKLHPLFVEALQSKARIEYWMDILLSGTPEEKTAFLAEHRKEVIMLERKIAEFSANRTMEHGKSERESDSHTER